MAFDSMKKCWKCRARGTTTLLKGKPKIVQRGDVDLEKSQGIIFSARIIWTLRISVPVIQNFTIENYTV